MRLLHVIWQDQFVEKIASKHHVTTDEVEQVLFSTPHVRRIERGKVKGEYLYSAYTTDYPELLSPVEVQAVLKSKHLEVEIDPSVMEALRLRAKQQGVPVGQLASELLRRQLETASP